MVTIELPNISIPALGMGTWQLKGDDCTKAVETALDIGYRHIDTAQAYENELDVGKAIKNTSVPRDEFFLTTKIWTDRFEAGDLEKSLDESLSKLGTDYVDLVLLHWPNDDVSMKETLDALEKTSQNGKTRYIGVSNFTVDHMDKAINECGANIVCNQVEYHPHLSQDPVLDFIRKREMFLTAYSPLGRGDIFDDKTMKEIAETHGKTPGQISLRWLLQQDRVAAIPKSGSEDHLQENFDIMDFQLSTDEMKRIFDLQRPDGRKVDPDFAPDWDTGKKAA